MLEKITAIRKALQDENQYAALALALTLPDICGQVEYPGKKVRERYKAWFDKYVFPQFYKNDDECEIPFDGNVCYQLRCSYLHSGNLDVEKYIDVFNLVCIKGTTAQFYNSYSVIGASKSIKLDVNGLCYFLCRAVEDYYKATTDKAIFDKYSSKITCYDDKDFYSLFDTIPVEI